MCFCLNAVYPPSYTPLATYVATISTIFLLLEYGFFFRFDGRSYICCFPTCYLFISVCGFLFVPVLRRLTQYIYIKVLGSSSTWPNVSQCQYIKIHCSTNSIWYRNVDWRQKNGEMFGRVAMLPKLGLSVLEGQKRSLTLFSVINAIFLYIKTQFRDWTNCSPSLGACNPRRRLTPPVLFCAAFVLGRWEAIFF